MATVISGIMPSVNASSFENFEVTQEEIDLERDLYIQELNKAILEGKIELNRTRSSSQDFDILGWNKKETFYFYGVQKWFGGFNFVVSNNSTSDTDVNFAVFEMNPNGTVGSKVSWWHNDIHAWESKNVSFDLWGSDVFFKDFAVTVENDGYFWQNNVRVSWTIFA